MTIPINSMVLGKLGTNGDRQTFGIGADGDPSPSLSTAHHHAVCYGINPQGGGMNPFDRELGETQSVCHQGGVMQVQCYDGYNQKGTDEVCMTIRSACGGTESNDATPKVAIGFKAGQSKDGGLGDEREVSPTLSHKPSALEPTLAQDNGNAVSFTRASFRRNNRFDISDATPTPTAKSSAGDTDVNIIQMRYIVRRLMPIECERLMGLPDGYTIPTGLRRFFDANGEPSPELVAEFQRIFDTFNAIMAEYEHKKPPKPKSAKQVAEWLKKISCAETCPDSPRYRGCGNGWATNQPRWILTRLLAIEDAK